MSYRKKFVNPHKVEKHLKLLSRQSRMDKETVRQLINYFNCICVKPPGKMPRSHFRAEMINRFKLMEDFMLDNLYRCFDQKNRGFILQDEYVRAMGNLLSDDIGIKTKLCFDVYDLNGDGFITRDEMLQWLKNSLVKQSHEEDGDEGIKELIEIHLKKLDVVDHDNKISLKDFNGAVAHDTLLMESLGSCLPNVETKNAFLLLVTGDLKYVIKPSAYSSACDTATC